MGGGVLFLVREAIANPFQATRLGGPQDWGRPEGKTELLCSLCFYVSFRDPVWCPPPPLCRLLSMAEGRLSHSDSRAHETGQEASTLRDQLAATMDSLRGLAGEHDAVRGELRAAHEDLEALVREGGSDRHDEVLILLMCVGGGRSTAGGSTGTRVYEQVPPSQTLPCPLPLCQGSQTARASLPPFCPDCHRIIPPSLPPQVPWMSCSLLSSPLPSPSPPGA